MATILEGLNAISQAVGGTGEAESNLEALNQISAALGGSTDAENNADAIANIAENASGGGGSSDFSTAEVTITNRTRTNYTLNLINVNVLGMNSYILVGATQEVTVNVVLYHGEGRCGVDFTDATVTGNVEFDAEEGFVLISGSGTIIIEA